jgi:hypothetical protein
MLSLKVTVLSACFVTAGKGVILPSFIDAAKHLLCGIPRDWVSEASCERAKTVGCLWAIEVRRK